MSVLAEVLNSTQPGYEAAVALSLQRMRNAFGEISFAECQLADFPDRATALLVATPLAPEVRLDLIADLSSLAWWCDFDLSDVAIGKLAAAARLTFYQQAIGLPPFRVTPDPLAMTSHAVFVGQLLHELHSPTRGAFDYVCALASDPTNRHVEVFHTGPLKPELRAYANQRLGDGASKTTFTEFDPSNLTTAIEGGARTYHFWCEATYSAHISLLALFGPSLMFTCGDAAPVQFADVYWYCQEPAYIENLWARKGAPESFSRNYHALQSAPFNKPEPLSRRTRADLGFGEDETIIVSVGNRLGVDMTESFVDGMGAILIADRNLRWVIVGALQDFWIDAFRQVLGDQFTHIPFDKDLPSLLAVCDIFANPFRAGGGNTAILAIDAGAAVMTRGDVGDVGAFVAPKHLAMSADEYFAQLTVLTKTPAMRGVWLKEQQALLATRLDQSLFATELKALVGLAFDRFRQRTPTALELIFDQPMRKPQALKASGRRVRLR